MIAISLLKKLDGLSQIERASIQSLADNHALDRQRGQMVQIVQRANAARRDQSATQTSQSVERRAQSRQIWSLQSSIARDIGIDKAPHARRVHLLLLRYARPNVAAREQATRDRPAPPCPGSRVVPPSERGSRYVPASAGRRPPQRVHSSHGTGAQWIAY